MLGEREGKANLQTLPNSLLKLATKLSFSTQVVSTLIFVNLHKKGDDVTVENTTFSTVFAKSAVFLVFEAKSNFHFYIQAAFSMCFSN